VKQYQPPVDEVSKIIDITEIHMRYGIEMLNTNLQSINWIKARSESTHDSTYSIASHDKPLNWFDRVNDQSVSQGLPSTILTSVDNDDQNSDYSDFITSQLDFSNEEGAPLNQSEPDVQSESYSDKVQSIPLEPSQTIVSDVIKGKQPSLVQQINEDTSIIGQYNQEQLQHHKNHVIDDLTVIAKAAFNIHTNQRGGIKTNALKESLMNESNIRSMTGHKYQPSRNTTLDGNKALAKELIAIHSQEEVQEWESCKCTVRGPFCILNAKLLILPLDESNPAKLGEDLVRCFIKMLQTQTRTIGFRDSIMEAIKFNLEKDGFPSAFEWINNRFIFLEGRKPKQESTGSGSNPSALSGKKTKEPYPLVDQRLVDYVNVNLQVIVNRKIESFGNDVPTMSDETKLSKFLYKLASEFFFRNKGWHNENSFTAPQHLTKLEETTGLKSKSSESFTTFKILKEIIDDFRSQYKERIVPRYLAK
jgi:hypothetical protein